MNCARARWLAISIAAMLLLVQHAPAPFAPRAVAAQADAPPLGAAAIEEPLTAPGIFRAGACPNGRAAAAFEGEGIVLRTTGRCDAELPVASLRLISGRVSLIDGDVEIETRITDAFERAYVLLQGRVQPTGDGYTLLWYPKAGIMQLMRDADEDDESITLARQVNLPIPAPGAWTKLALRFEGPRIWALMDGQVALSATDDYFDEGGVAIGVVRRPKADDDAGDEDGVFIDAPFADAFDDVGEGDDEAVSTTWRNLRVSALANGVTARAPTLRAVGERPTTGPPFVPAAGTPPKPGEVIVEQALDRPGLFPTYSCPTGRGSIAYVGEGMMFKTNGRCTASSTAVVMGFVAGGLSVRDGEVRFEFKVTNGADRVGIGADARYIVNGVSHLFWLRIADGGASIQARGPSERETIARRTDLSPLFVKGDWNTFAMRYHGSDLWLLINERPVLRARDERSGTGEGMWLTIQRLGSVDDDQEVAVVFRNLRVSALDGAPDDRRPTYRP